MSVAMKQTLKYPLIIANKLIIALLCLFTALSYVPAFAETGTIAALFGQKTQKFLPVNQAFKVNVLIDGNELIATFKVTPEHYVYRDKMILNLPENVSASDWQFDKTATMIDDPTFGRVAVFEEDVVAKTVLTGDANNAQASLRWQGCAKAGLCYPPENIKFNISLANDTAIKTDKEIDAPPTVQKASPPKVVEQAVASVKDAPKKISQPAKPDTPKPTPANIVTPVLQSDTDIASSDKMADDKAGYANGNSKDVDSIQDESSANVQIETSTPPTNSYSLNHHLERIDPFGIHDNPALAIGLLFLAGLLLAFTPCVYPMIPIVANIVARQGGISSKKGLVLSASYGVGVATAYGLLGALIAWLGRTVNILGYLQNPILLIGFAVIFVLLGLYMFGVIKVGLPSKMRNKLQATSQSADRHLGSLSGSFLAGALSALVVSPCVSAPMAGVLVAVSVSGSVPLGFLAMFALGLGLCVPLMMIGMAQGKFMPKAGAWMVKIKEFCGLLLFAVALILLERVFVLPAMLIAWAMWFALMGVWLWQLMRLPFRAAAILMLAWATTLVFGAGMGSSDAWRPLSVITHSKTQQMMYEDRHVKTLAELDEILATHDKVLIDATADWCVECRIMDRELFVHRPTAMADIQLVKFDITEMNDDSLAFLQRYELMGPPALLMYQEGKLMQVLLGQTSRADFEQALMMF